LAEKNNEVMDKLVSLCKRRGFIFQSSEIYGGINSCYDYGPMGVELKKNIRELWWKAMVYERDDIEGLDASILMHPRVWEASGHVEGFTDPMVDCKKCKARFRADQLDQVQCPEKPSKHPGECGGELTEPRLFNLMFKTFMGPVEDDANIVFIRPETAQGIYVNFHNVREASRRKLPFGIAQTGKAFRNEITPGNYIFRTREFEQMEMQYFVKPGSDDDWFEYWKEERLKWYKRLGIRKENLHFHQHSEKELAHYAKAAFDIEFKFPFGWSEIEGIHNRTDFDLGRHQDYSKKNLQYFDQEAGERYVPYVVETSTGVDRLMLTALADAYHEEEVQGDKRVVMRLSPVIAPMKAAVFPLVKKDGMPEIALKIVDSLRKRFRVFYDESGAVGRRYRRQDEIGTPYCFTVDSQTLEDGTVTVRDRDTMVQERISRDKVMDYLLERVVV
jgi:glycyl-tRNA synthetase